MENKDQFKKILLPDYKMKFDKLYQIAFELHKMEYFDIEEMVIKKMAGLKMMIDYIEKE